MGGIGHVGGCCEESASQHARNQRDTRGISSYIAKAQQGCWALVTLLGSGTDSDPHTSNPSFRVEAVKVCLRDLNRPCSTVFDCDFYDPDSVQYLQLRAGPRAGSTEPDPTEHVDCHGYIREYVRDFGVS